MKNPKFKPLFRIRYDTELLDTPTQIERVVAVWTPIRPGGKLVWTEGVILDNGMCRERWMAILYRSQYSRGGKKRKPYEIHLFRRLAEARVWAKHTLRRTRGVTL